jgi:ubiquinone biosynthesis protein
MRLRGAAAVSPLIRCARILGVLSHRSAEISWRAAVIGRRSHDDELTRSLAHQFRLALEDLGPTFVKLGQLLSARSDITPPLVQHELAKLQDHAPSIPREQLLTELELSLGSKPQSHFAVLEIAPVACGSIAQVHRATLHNGRGVAVKVRRPGIRDAIDADVRLVGYFLRLVSRVSSRIRAYDPVAILDEFAALLRAETDFRSEARNLEAVGRTFAENGSVTIPAAITDMSSESVLVMDWIEGVPLTNHEGLSDLGANRSVLARTILQAYGIMIFRSDRFHADPHPGNLIATDAEHLGLIDFGEVGSVEPAERSALLQMMAAVIAQDGEGLAHAVLSVSRTIREVDATEFGAPLTDLLDIVSDTSPNSARFGEILGRLLHLVREYGIVLPSDLAVLIKTMIECEATTKGLDPDMSMLDLVGELGSFGSSPTSDSL